MVGNNYIICTKHSQITVSLFMVEECIQYTKVNKMTLSSKSAKYNKMQSTCANKADLLGLI